MKDVSFDPQDGRKSEQNYKVHKNSIKLSFKATHGTRIKGVKLGNKNNTRKLHCDTMSICIFMTTRASPVSVLVKQKEKKGNIAAGSQLLLSKPVLNSKLM